MHWHLPLQDLWGSDLANMINEAAINAVKNGRQLVNQSDLFEAFELVAVGGKEKKDRVMSDKERKIVSYHEVGHALVSALQKTQSLCRKSQSYHVPWEHSDIHSRHLKRRNTLRQRDELRQNHNIYGRTCSRGAGI